MVSVAVLIPTYKRPQQLRERVGNLLQLQIPNDAQLFVVIGICADDDESKEAMGPLVGTPKADRVYPVIVMRQQADTAVSGWNKAYVHARAAADWFVLGADDIVWHDGWLSAALRAASETGAQVIGLNDLHTDLDQYAPHYMVRRAFIDAHMGGFMVPPVYKSWWFDREVCEKARILNLYAPAWNAVAEHRHPDWTTAPRDATYDLAWPLHDIDREIYMIRKANGYPIDYEVLT